MQLMVDPNRTLNGKSIHLSFSKMTHLQTLMVCVPQHRAQIGESMGSYTFGDNVPQRPKGFYDPSLCHDQYRNILLHCIDTAGPSYVLTCLPIMINPP